MSHQVLNKSCLTWIEKVKCKQLKQTVWREWVSTEEQKRKAVEMMCQHWVLQ